LVISPPRRVEPKTLKNRTVYSEKKGLTGPAWGPARGGAGGRGTAACGAGGLQAQGCPVPRSGGFRGVGQWRGAAEPDSPFSSPGQQQLTVQNVSGNNLTISGLSPTQIQLQMEQALSGEIQPGEKRRRMACTCPNCKDGEKR